MRIYLEIEVRRVDCSRCGGVKRERLSFLGDNPFYTKRFSYYVGRRRRQSDGPMQLRINDLWRGLLFFLSLALS